MEGDLHVGKKIAFTSPNIFEGRGFGCACPIPGILKVWLTSRKGCALTFK